MGNNSNSKLKSGENKTEIKGKENLRVKIMLVGDGEVGKTGFLDRFINNRFTGNYFVTIGSNYVTKIINIQNKNIYLYIIDCSGVEKYRFIEVNNYNSADGIILMYDVHNQNSFKNILNRSNSIQNLAKNNLCKVFVGNKCDNDSNIVVTKEEGENLANELGTGFFEASIEVEKMLTKCFIF